APASWARLRAKLLADPSVEETLKKHFAAAVDICAGDRYFRRHLAENVLAAGKACGGLGGAVPPPPAGPRRKRQRQEPPQETSVPLRSDSASSSSCSPLPLTGGDSA
ncbi:unnamed protein product, partial [Polarella glacialis]